MYQNYRNVHPIQAQRAVVRSKREVMAFVREIMRQLGNVKPNFVQMLQILIILIHNAKNIRLDVSVMEMDVSLRALV